MNPLLQDISVNGRVIPAAAIALEAQNHPAPKGKPGLAWQAAARALALREILLQAAQARGLTPNPQPVGPDRIESADEALIRQFLDDHVQPTPVADAQVRAAYDAAPDRFRAPDLWEAAHILLAATPEDRAQRASARALAEDLIARLQASPDQFAALARTHSACPSASSGGKLGQVGPGDTVAEFEAALYDLEEGQIAPAPVETRFGLHIIRLDARATGAVLPFEAVAPRLRTAAEKTAWARAVRDLTDRLTAAVSVTGVSLDPARIRSRSG